MKPNLSSHFHIESNTLLTPFCVKRGARALGRRPISSHIYLSIYFSTSLLVSRDLPGHVFLPRRLTSLASPLQLIPLLFALLGPLYFSLFPIFSFLFPSPSSQSHLLLESVSPLTAMYLLPWQCWLGPGLIQSVHRVNSEVIADADGMCLNVSLSGRWMTG